MPHYHGAAIGSFTDPDAVEQDTYIEYDICPGCGDIKQAGSALCLRCAGRKLADRMEAEWEAETAPGRHNRERFYDEMRRWYGWTIQDIIRHTRQVRRENGDAVIPRFWTGQSIGRPKRKNL